MIPTRTLTVIAAIWGTVLCLLFVFAAPLVEKLWVLYLPIHWGVPLFGALILVIALPRAVRRMRPAAPAIVIATVGLALFFTCGFRLGRMALFQIRKPHYDQLLEESIRTGEVPDGDGYTDQGPPVRFAFFWQRGVVDNWVGIVHDPTGLVAEVNRASGWNDLRDPRWNEAVRLFGGDLYKCEKLQGDWYLCWFT